MAVNRYWVGGTGNWSDTAHWSTTSGGAGGQTAPSSSMNVFFNGSSGGGTVTVDTAASASRLDFTGFTGTVTGTSSLSVGGNLTLVSGMTWTYTGTLTLGPQSGNAAATLLTGGKTLDNLTYAPSITSFFPSLTLGDACTITNDLTITTGEFNQSTYALSCRSLLSTGTSRRKITLGSGGLTLTGTGTVLDFTDPTLLEFVHGNSTIAITATGSNTRYFKGGGQRFWNLILSAGYGSLTFTGANIFNVLSLIPSGGALAVDFTTAGQTAEYIYLTMLTGSSITGKLISCRDTTVYNTVFVRAVATGGGVFDARSSTNSRGRGNVGWLFGDQRGTGVPLPRPHTKRRDLPPQINWNLPIQLDKDRAKEFGLVTWHPGAENGGTRVRDYGGKRVDGTIYYGTTRNRGKFGEPALKLTASSTSYMDITNAAGSSLNFTGPFSVSTWVYLNSGTNANQVPIGKVVGGASGWMIYNENSSFNNWAFFCYGLSTVSISSSTANVRGAWEMVTGVYTGTSLKIYVNGVLKATQAVTGSPTTTTNGCWMGVYTADFVTFYWVDGGISQPMTFNRALSDAQVAELYRNPFALAWQPTTRTTVYGNGSTEGIAGGRNVRNVVSGYTQGRKEAPKRIDWNLPIRLDKDKAQELGVVAWYPGKEGGGTTLWDYSGKGNNGTLVGGPTRTRGKFGEPCLSFDATDDYVNCGSGPLLYPSGAITILARVYPVTLGFIFSSWGSVGGQNRYASNWDGANFFASFRNSADTDTVFRQTSTGQSANQWYHYGAVINGPAGTIDLYVDGSLNNGTQSGSGTGWHSSTPPTTIGRLRVGDTYGQFGGLISGVTVCGKALTAAQIAHLYRNPFALAWQPSRRTTVYGNGIPGEPVERYVSVARKPPPSKESIKRIDWNLPVQLDKDKAQELGVVACYPGKEGGGTILRDYSGKGQHGTLTNGPTWTRGKFGEPAISFDGTDDYVSLASILSTNHAYSCWFYPTSNTVDRVIASQAAAAGAIYDYLFIGGAIAGDPLGFDVVDTTGCSARTTNSFTVNAWNHGYGEATVSGGTVTARVSLNNGTIATATYSGSLPAVTQAAIGALGQPALYFPGYISNLIISRPLSDSQRAELYRNPFSIYWQPTAKRTFYMGTAVQESGFSSVYGMFRAPASNVTATAFTATSAVATGTTVSAATGNTVGFIGTSAPSIGAVVLAATGSNVSFVGTSAVAAGSTVLDATGVNVANVGTSALAAGSVVLAAAGSNVSFIGTSAVAAGSTVLAATGSNISFIGTSAVAVGTILLAGTGSNISFIGTSSLASGSTVLAATGSNISFIATSTLTTGVVVLAATGSLVNAYTATAALAVGSQVLAASGTLVGYTATSALTGGTVVLDGTGVLGNLYTAAPDLVAGSVTMSASGTAVSFIGTSAATTGAIAMASVGTLASVFYGTADLASGAVTLSGSGAMAAFVATAAFTGGVVVLSASGTLVNVYSATAAMTIGGVTTSAGGTAVSFIGTGALTSSVVTISASGTLVNTYTATAAFTVGSVVLAGLGGVGSNVGAGAVTVGSITTSGTGASAVPSYTATSSLVVGAGVMSSSGTAVSFIGTSAITVSHTTMAAVGSAVSFIGTSTVTSGAAILAATAAYTPPNFGGTSALQVGIVTITASGTAISYIGTSALVAGALVLAGTGDVLNHYIATATLQVSSVTMTSTGLVVIATRGVFSVEPFLELNPGLFG